ncbi:MAG: glycolate oxidase subunit GlcE [Sphingomonadales bacterium]
MADLVKPGSPGEVADIVRRALRSRTPLEILGSDSKRNLGRPVTSSRRVALAGLSGILLYEPSELVLTARAGTPLAAIERELQAHRQCLAFEPANLGGLLGNGRGAGTIGGAIACNSSGPRRIKAGAARDHILGFKAVTGRGEAIKSGGRVMKNVTGFDLSKLMAGSYGTLAVLAEVTIKIWPAPERVCTLLAFGLADADALSALNAAAGSPLDVSGFAHLPARVAGRSRVAEVTNAKMAVTAFRVEGIDVSVASRVAALKKQIGGKAELGELDDLNSRHFWREVRDLAVLPGDDSNTVWRLSLPPARAVATVEEITAAFDADWFYDWAGGLVWLAPPPGQERNIRAVRDPVRAAGGHATLVRGSESLRADAPAFEPLEPALMRLTRRIKDGFDPQRILNPGRMYPEL